ncbi:ATP-dependent DNA helicase PIF1 [Phanerochaete sordida]|uniref:ATP-dependent DNA helicase PIF1 n=1 Tax=Phanerochaete sordida TaxID=48140 RepID=A0A9P3G9Z6_9APHY|nr:ATP-dependent DNA helicase PIF1 [Phanerochaete sordida]
MSQSSGKQVMSGLRTVKRDFSSNSVTSSSQTTDSGESSRQQKLSASERRLKLIQDALSGMSAPEEKKQPFSGPGRTVATGSNSNFTGSKRSAPADNQPAAKKRQLPSSWNTSFDEKSSSIASYSSTRTLSASASANSATKTTITVASTTQSSSKTSGVFLSQEQTHILKLVEAGESLFYTGSAGTGKSVLLREIIRVLRKRFSKTPDAIAITASTGIAACNIGGVTIHSFAGIGIGVDSAEQLTTRIRKNKKAMSRWLRTKVLIIDEVSMVDGDLFDKLAQIGSALRKDPRPFGGIQVIVTGDFFQLPPVAKGDPKFAFEADYWKKAVKKTFNLTKVFRQSDPEFVDMLNEMRFGRLTTDSITRFMRLSRPIQYDDGVSATELFPRREDVERANGTRMRTLNTETHEYTASHGGKLFGTEQGEKLLTNFMAPGKLTLKLGAQVMLIKNMDEMNVNGSMGTIVEFVEPNQYLQNPDDPYVASTKPGSKPNSAAPASKEPKKTAAMGMKWPVVEFTNPKRKMLIQPESWKVELPDGEVQISRTQLPLILAWAMSIHKSQGQTLERVKVDLARIFEKGQAYVALSRATSLEGLQVLNFDPAKVKAHPKVVEWSRTLEVVPV